MAVQTRRQKHDWEAQMASVSLAGIRPLVMSSVSVGATSNGSYLVSDNDMTERLVVYHDSGNNLDIRFDISSPNAPATATATSFPIGSGIYFVMEVDNGETLSLYNTSAGAITVYVCEIR